MLNKSFKPWSLALVLLLATSYLEVAALPTVKENPERVALEQRAAAGDQDAQVELNYAASSGGLGFNDLTGLAYLEQRAAAGDRSAQSHLNYAAHFGKLGFTAETGRAYLQGRVRDGDQHAQQLLNTAASPSSASPTRATPAATLSVGIPSSLAASPSSTSPTRATPVAARSDRRPTSLAGPTRATPVAARADRRPTLGDVGNDDPDAIAFEKYAKNNGGNAYNGEFALLKLYKAALEGELGFNAVTGRKYLEGHAEKNDESAQHYLNCAARECKLGFNAETGLTYLLARAARGDKNAQEQLNEAAFDGELGFNAETGLKYFKERAARGDKNAQSQINRAACFAKLIFTDKTGLTYLEEREKSGDENAKIWLKIRGITSLFEGEHSALHRSSEPLYPKKENKSGEALLPSMPSMPSSASVSALPIEPNPQDAINKALEREVNQGNAEEVRKLLNRPAGQLGPDKIAIDRALESAHKQNNQSIIIILQNELIKILKTAIIPSVVGPSMPSSVAPSATPPAAITLDALGNNNPAAKKLEELVNSGKNSFAQNKLNEEANKGELGFTAETGLTYLLARAAAGDANAQKLLNKKPLPHR